MNMRFWYGIWLYDLVYAPGLGEYCRTLLGTVGDLGACILLINSPDILSVSTLMMADEISTRVPISSSFCRKVLIIFFCDSLNLKGIGRLNMAAIIL